MELTRQLNNEIKIFNEYLRGKKIMTLKNDNRFPFVRDILAFGENEIMEAPDFYFKNGKDVLIMEHFEFDSYQTTKKGSKFRTAEASIKRDLDSVEASSCRHTIHREIEEESSYQDYIENITRSFETHYGKIDSYISNLTKKGVICDDTAVFISFLIHDASPLGTAVSSDSGWESGYEPVTLAKSKEFLTLLKNNPRVDFVFACSSMGSKKYTWFIDRIKLEDYFKECVDYQHRQFITFNPQVTGFKGLL